MSRATLYVRFPDGSVRYGIYNGTADVAMRPLFDHPRQGWDTDRDAIWTLGRDEAGSGEPVLIATDYGAGFSWNGTATRDSLTSATDLIEDDIETQRGLPEWAVWPVVADRRCLRCGEDRRLCDCHLKEPK